METSALVKAIRSDQSAMIGRSRRRHSPERVEREARPIIERAVGQIQPDVTGWDPENLVGEVLSALPAWLGRLDETHSDEEIAVYLHRRIVGAVSDAKRKADPTATTEAYRIAWAVFVAAVKGIDTSTPAGRISAAEATISAAHTHAATQRCAA